MTIRPLRRESIASGWPEAIVWCMALLTSAQAKNLLVVDPESGLQIEHIKAVDPEKCWFEQYTINKCEPGCEAVFQKPDGTWETRDWTPVVTRLGDGSAPEFLTHTRTQEFDLVDKNTGEVVTEARFDYTEFEEVEPNGNDLEPRFGSELDVEEAL
jgi:hypothetical protein